MHNILKKACGNRAVAATKCNERSSRSHSVFRLKLVGTNESTGEESTGIFYTITSVRLFLCQRNNRVTDIVLLMT